MMTIHNRRSSFEERRAWLSHSVLQNGILLRLATPGAWSARNLPREERLRELTLGWKGLERKPDSIAKAVQVWEGDNDAQKAVPDLVHELCKTAREGRRFKPRDSFPTTETIDSWLQPMSAVVECLRKPPADVADLPAEEVEKFWLGAMALTEFVARLQPGSPHFFEYFERIGD